MSKQPFGGIDDGETRITRLLVGAAAASFSVSVVALAEQPAEGAPAVDLVEVPKPPLRLGRLIVSSARRRRSLIHCRFAPRTLVDVLGAEAADVFVARRVYMAEAALDARRAPPGDRLVVLADVLESTNLRHAQTRWRCLAVLEAARTRRDELRCLRAASEVAFLSETESKELASVVTCPQRMLDLALPPAARPAALVEPVAVFVGDRRAPANADAVAKLLALWPSIARYAPKARLLIVGHPAPAERLIARSGVDLLGFVDDLDPLWQSAAVLLAPVRIGGGVRVKILDAARHGVPVVGSQEAIGSTDRYLPLRARALDTDFATEAARLLTDTAERQRQGELLFETNRTLHSSGFVEEQVAELIAGSARRKTVDQRAFSQSDGSKTQTARHPPRSQ